MEITLPEVQGLPRGCLVSIRIGDTRRQAPADKTRFKLNFPRSDANNIAKVDLLAPIGSFAVELQPDQQRYPVQMPSPAGGSPIRLTLAVNDVEESKPGFVATKCSSPSGGVQPARQGDAAAVAKELTGLWASAQEARGYLDEHKVLTWIQSLLCVLIKERPGDPWAFVEQHSAAYGKRREEEGLPAQTCSEEPEPEMRSAETSAPAVASAAEAKRHGLEDIGGEASAVGRQQSIEKVRLEVRAKLMQSFSYGRLMKVLADDATDAPTSSSHAAVEEPPASREPSFQKAPGHTVEELRSQMRALMHVGDTHRRETSLGRSEGGFTTEPSAEPAGEPTHVFATTVPARIFPGSCLRSPPRAASPPLAPADSRSKGNALMQATAPCAFPSSFSTKDLKKERPALPPVELLPSTKAPTSCSTDLPSSRASSLVELPQVVPPAPSAASAKSGLSQRAESLPSLPRLVQAPACSEQAKLEAKLKEHTAYKNSTRSGNVLLKPTEARPDRARSPWEEDQLRQNLSILLHFSHHDHLPMSGPRLRR